MYCRFIFVICVAGCGPIEVPDIEQSGVFYCETQEDCLAGYQCGNNKCYDMNNNCNNNNVRDNEEQCDGEDLGFSTCITEGYDGGLLSCYLCNFNVMSCVGHGDNDQTDKAKAVDISVGPLDLFFVNTNGKIQVLGRNINLGDMVYATYKSVIFLLESSVIYDNADGTQGGGEGSVCGLTINNYVNCNGNQRLPTKPTGVKKVGSYGLYLYEDDTAEYININNGIQNLGTVIDVSLPDYYLTTDGNIIRAGYVPSPIFVGLAAKKIAGPCWIDEQGYAYCVGNNSYGQDTPPNIIFRNIFREHAVCCREDGYMCGITIDFQAKCWGDNSYQQLNCPPDEKFTTLSLSEKYACGINETNNIICWGTVPEAIARYVIVFE